MNDNEKRFNNYCKNMHFSDNDVQKIFKLVELNDGMVNAIMIRGHFAIGWAASVRMAEEMSSCELAVLEDKITGGIKRLPKEDQLGLYKDSE